ncbi:MAG TPA: nucleotidyltransferase domain-containing protein [Treponemataceae bacterium]|nr:nucleotidyltransferase domain-containing protein [Treponemataceae bacterium]
MIESALVSTGLSPIDITEMVTIFSQFSHIDSVFLFGSRAKGAWKPGSDVDLCVFGSSFSAESLIRLSAALNEDTLSPFQFDVVSWSLLENAELKSHIKRVGFQIFPAENDV